MIREKLLVCFFSGLILSSLSCQRGDGSRLLTTPDLKVVRYDLDLTKADDGWLYQGKLFSGYMIEEEKDHRMVYQLPIIEGKENGLALGWYNTGKKLLERLYIDGKKEGAFKQWWPNGNYRYQFHYKNDLMEGIQLVLFPDKKKQQESNFVAGKEEGRQQIWDKDGALISNYTIKKGKLYGVIASKSCIPAGH